MKRIILFVLGIAIASNAAAWFKCEPKYNDYGAYTIQCEKGQGKAPESATRNYGAVANNGDIRRVRKYSDGTVFVERFGHDGEVEEDRETSPGTWERW